MITQPYRLYIERRDASRNMARFYSIEIESTLFGGVCLTRRWGRIGARGRSAAHQFSKEEEAIRLFLELARRKRNRGYRPRSVGSHG
ncbi:WGR domain-containing protein [Ensifer sp. NPDC090286]|uniref:WGR domain-containing protein n=1 Tax=Ensifer sp. NPDC090286 TaxID=3363991 RepID=UPI003839FC31